MLIINGTAELMHNNKEFTKGTRHEFNMFSKEMPFEQQLSQIEAYLVNRGWDNIEVLSNGVVSTPEDITHNVLQRAYEKAQAEGLAVTVNNQPLT
jgi:DNA invertase Pin-like site-specific DNA recombinase